MSTTGTAPTAEEVADLRRRLIELEAEVWRLKEQLGRPDERIGPGWLARVAGSFKDDPDFEEVIRLGREWREARRAEAEAEADAEDRAKNGQGLENP